MHRRWRPAAAQDGPVTTRVGYRHHSPSLAERGARAPRGHLSSPSGSRSRFAVRPATAKWFALRRIACLLVPVLRHCRPLPDHQFSEFLTTKLGLRRSASWVQLRLTHGENQSAHHTGQDPRTAPLAAAKSSPA